VRQAAADASVAAAPVRRQAQQPVNNTANIFTANSFDTAENVNAPFIANGMTVAAPVRGSQTYSASSLVTR
jgi:hypothetical protein